MINYDEVNRGDILKVVGVGLPGICELGDLVRVKSRTVQGVLVETSTGKEVECVFNCGAARLEPTEWKNDFPDNPPSEELEESQESTLNKQSDVIFCPKCNRKMDTLKAGGSVCVACNHDEFMAENNTHL